MKKTSIKKLLAIYDAIGGMVSEMPDPFDHFYNGGTDKLLGDFESVLKECGVQFAEREPGNYYIVSYHATLHNEKRWGICTDKNHPNASWVLTGFETPADALNVIMNPKVFDDYNGQPVEEIDANV